MKKFKQFRAEQQYITEVGPFASAMMGAMGVIGLGFAGWKAFKKTKEAIKGYRETKADKKARKEDGFTMSLKVYNPATDKEELQDFYVDPKEGNPDLEKLGYKLPKTLGGGIKAPSDDELDKMEKEAGKKAKRANAGIKRKIKSGNYDPDDLTTDQQTQLSDKTTKAEKEKTAKEKGEKAAAGKSVSDWVGHEPTDEIPAGMKTKVKEKERKALGGHKDVLAYRDRWDMKPEASLTGWKKWYDDPEDKDDFEYITTDEQKKKTDARAGQNEPTGGGSGNNTPKVTKRVTKSAAAHTNPKDLKRAGVQTTGRILNFGEFISEDVMKDLLKAGKSKKDSEITLDDGADIPIDPLTSQILVKYIEGLSSSEKKRTIQQIQRTERAFMKVLGKAHENT